MVTPLYSIIIPVYKNADSVSALIEELELVNRIVLERFDKAIEVVFVVDGSPDDCYERLRANLPNAGFRSQLLLHSRNFGSFAAIRTGLKAGRGDFFGIVAADLQEPPQLLVDFLQHLKSDDYDVVVGTRIYREDPYFSRVMSSLFWKFYCSIVIPQMPRGGVDVFGCNRRFRDELLALEEANSSLVGLVFWLGFRRKEIGYARRKRLHGGSSWTFKKKLTYLLDSVFSFTDLPIRLLAVFGALGTGIAIILGLAILVLRMVGSIEVPGYTATAIIILFFGALNMLGLGLVGSYAWRAYENTKHRPLSVLLNAAVFPGRQDVEKTAAAGGTSL